MLRGGFFIGKPIFQITRTCAIFLSNCRNDFFSFSPAKDQVTPHAFERVLQTLQRLENKLTPEMIDSSWIGRVPFPVLKKVYRNDLI